MSDIWREQFILADNDRNEAWQTLDAIASVCEHRISPEDAMRTIRAIMAEHERRFNRS